MPRLLSLLIKSKSALVKKTQLKRLHQQTPWCLSAMKCLCQAYARKIQKDRGDKVQKLQLKTLQCVVAYLEHSQNQVQLKDLEFLKKLLLMHKAKHGICLKDLVDLDLWRTVFCGSMLAELYCSGQLDKYKLTVQIAELGEIHPPDVI